MKKIIFVLSSFLIRISYGQNLDINIDKATVTIASIDATFHSSQGTDGRIICYPSHWTTSGTDGRIVAYPKGWTWEQGRDGRKVVRPNGNSTNLVLIFNNPEYLTQFEELKNKMNEKELINYILYAWINMDNNG